MPTSYRRQAPSMLWSYNHNPVAREMLRYCRTARDPNEDDEFEKQITAICTGYPRHRSGKLNTVTATLPHQEVSLPCRRHDGIAEEHQTFCVGSQLLARDLRPELMPPYHAWTIQSQRLIRSKWRGPTQACILAQHRNRWQTTLQGHWRAKTV